MRREGVHVKGAWLYQGEALEALRSMPDAALDAIVTDPPYGLANTTPEDVTAALTRWLAGDREWTPSGRGFMGHEWDAFVPPPAVWDECLLKPLDLMRWLVRLVTPPGGMVLDPFAGSGTTGEAAILEGFRAVMVEANPDYWPLIHERMNRP